MMQDAPLSLPLLEDLRQSITLTGEGFSPPQATVL
ncbi:hypothetical protein Krac_12161 [Ktedonobacter racemifer DSM 44963]|uniref:Uncharacterized protein n=1 Tax=Ktedonobacter racemifer DSM 44963 TaxID=485913 RepID=D6TFQ5_KTERA|nr:hypothetical protein Krac_12161 [Ktedonobacter racemifer DSM 44963]